MKNVLLLASTLRRTGPTRQLLNLSRFLPEFGYRPTVLTLSKEPGDSLLGEFQLSDVRTQSLGLSRIGGFLRGAAALERVIQSVQPTVIHTCGIRSDIIGHCAAGRVAHVLTVRNSAWEDYPVKYGKAVGGLLAWRHLRVIQRAQYPIACSSSTARNLQSLRPDIQVVANGVDTVAFSPVNAADRLRLRQALGLAVDRRVIVSVGSLSARKQPQLLLNGFLRSRVHELADLIFVGTGRMQPELERASGGLEAVRFSGQITNVVDYLRCADIFVSMSRAEGLPNSVLEAMSCGLPVILSDIEPHRELMVKEAGCGSLVDASAEHGIALALKVLLDTDRSVLSRRARAHVEENYSAMRTAESYAHIYERVCECW